MSTAPSLPGMPAATRTKDKARKRRCQDCDSTEDVRAYSVDDYPVEWGPYYLCRNCRGVLEAWAAEDLARTEARLLAEWGTIGQRKAS